ncbi:UNVERIFIED_CONTAM: hypothetical protein O8I53_06430 [Campylobacter lari]
MNNDVINAKGRFKKIFAGGPAKDFTYTLASFTTEDGKNYTIYMTKTKIEIDAYYEINIVKQNGKSNYTLKDLKTSKPENNGDIKSMILKNVDGMGMATIEKIEKSLKTTK